MNSLSQEAMMLAQALGWTILHSLWQGAIIFCSMKLLLKAIGPTNARARYYTTLACLTAMVIWTADTFARQWQKIQVVTVTAGHQPYTGSEQIYTTTLPAATPTETILHRILPGIEAYFPFIAVAYMLGIFLMLLRLILGINKVYRLRHNHIAAPPAEWIDHTNRWVKLVGISRPVQVLLSHKVTIPMVAGTLKPFILFPFAAASHLTTRQFEAILLHELAHIKRNDYLLNILQIITETLLFFNPFVWLISADIRREREHCCDDLVLSHTPQPIVYAKALAALEANRFVAGRLAMNATGNNKQQLLHRIKRIVEMKKQPLNVKHMAMSLVAIACIVVTAGWLAPSFAQTKNKEQKKKTEKNTPAANAGKASSANTYAPSGDDSEDDASAPVAKAANGRDDVDWDKINDEVAKAQAETEKALAKIDWDKINAEIAKAQAEGSKAMAEVDWEKVKADVAKAKAEVEKEMANIDWDKIKADMAKAKDNHRKAMKDHNEAMEDVDWDKINAEVNAAMKEMNKAMAEVDWNAIGSTITNAMSGFDTEQEGSHSRKQTVTARANSTNGSANIVVTNPSYGSGKNSQHVTAVTSNSEVSSTQYEKMLINMENEGLIDIDKGYTIKKSGNDLTIDGKRQPREVLEKYSKYLEGDRIVVAGDKDYLKISVKD